MGSTLTTASVSAADLITTIPQEDQSLQSTKYHHKSYQGEPPPECPMHKSDPKPKTQMVSECPIDHMDAKDINPLNMVIVQT